MFAGAMGKAVEPDGSMSMQCQSCHGQMANVGKPGRTGWLDQPNCQSCHHDGLRDKTAVDASGVLKVWADTRFATNPNVPKTGFSLYRFSKGHGNLQCEACHGSTHAEYPTSHANDNVMSKEMQGHEGTLVECAACHKTVVPLTVNGGPHGMHTIGAAWVSRHQSVAESATARAGCATCHGSNFRGSVLSQVKVAKTFNADGRTVSYAAGQAVTCYDCHNGPNGD
jgi:NAD-dependent SIR2 family protein deacetylase